MSRGPKSEVRRQIVRSIAQVGDGKPVHPLEVCRRLSWPADRVCDLLHHINEINSDGDPSVFIVLSRNGLYLAERLDQYKELLLITQKSLQSLNRLRRRIDRMHR